MCLSSDFFDERERVLRDREAKGELELSAFLKARRIPFDRVLQAGFLAWGETMCTADLSPFVLARSGRRYLREDKDWQILFVRKSRQAAFAQAIRVIRDRMRLISRRTHALLQAPRPLGVTR